MDLTNNLKSFRFENGLGEEEKRCVFLRNRSSALAACACAHAVFLCRLMSLARDKLNNLTNKSDAQQVKVGIIGGGHMGKQLAMLLLTIPGFEPAHINMSTKRPDTLTSHCTLYTSDKATQDEAPFSAHGFPVVINSKAGYVCAKPVYMPRKQQSNNCNNRIHKMPDRTSHMTRLDMTNYSSSRLHRFQQKNKSEFSGRGVRCYFDNRRLAAWADVIFLCVLPSHLRHVCAELHSQLPARCLVYSFTSAAQLHRLALLLGHTFVVRPHYGFVTCDSGELWIRHNQVAAALKDEEVLRASRPLSMSGGLTLDQRWASALFYSLLNVCTAEGLTAKQTLQLLNELVQATVPSVALTCQSFVNSSWASTLNNSDQSFPWIKLIDVQTKQSPFTSCLSECKALQECIAVMYQKTFSG